MVTAICGSVSKTKNVTISQACSSITPTLNDVETPGAVPLTAAGAVTPVSMSATYKQCADGGKSCFRVDTVREEHTFGTVPAASRGRVDVNSANDAVVTPATCQAIIADLTPPAAAGTGAGPPRTTYMSTNISAAHERFHVDDLKARVYNPVMNDLAAFVSQASNCTECVDPSQTASKTASFDAKLQNLYTTALANFRPGAEIRAHDFERALYFNLINSIKQRAQNAPAAQNWPAQCKP